MGLSSYLKRKVTVIGGPGIPVETHSGTVFVQEISQVIYVERFPELHAFIIQGEDYEEGQPLDLSWADIDAIRKFIDEYTGENHDKADYVSGALVGWVRAGARWHVQFGVATTNMDSDTTGFTSFEYIGG